MLIRFVCLLNSVWTCSFQQFHVCCPTAATMLKYVATDKADDTQKKRNETQNCHVPESAWKLSFRLIFKTNIYLFAFNSLNDTIFCFWQPKEKLAKRRKYATHCSICFDEWLNGLSASYTAPSEKKFHQLPVECRKLALLQSISSRNYFFRLAIANFRRLDSTDKIKFRAFLRFDT